MIDTKAYIVRGVIVPQIFQRFPVLEPIYTTFEKNYDAVFVNAESKVLWPHVPVLICALYLLLIFGGRKYMESRPAHGDTNRQFLAAWNLFLSVFSFIGAFRTVPHLLLNLTNNTFMSNICTPPAQDWGAFSTGLWVQLFVFSKPVELIDTYFIVVRKRPLIFLHWYHHITVLLFCWHSYVHEAPNALFFVAVNYSVHAVMYGYYFLMAIRMKPKWLNPFFITLAQISQMVVGIIVCLFSYYYKYKNQNQKECAVSNSNLLSGTVMYGSYLALFVKFAVDRYLGKAGMSTGNEKNGAGAVDGKKKKEVKEE